MKTIKLGMKSKQSDSEGKDVEVTHHPEFSFTGHPGLKMPEGPFEMTIKGRHVAMDKRERMHPDGPHHTIEVHEITVPGNEEQGGNNNAVKNSVKQVMDSLQKPASGIMNGNSDG